MPKLTLIVIRSHDNLPNGKLFLCAGMMKLTDCNDRRRQATRPNERKPFIEAAQDMLFLIGPAICACGSNLIRALKLTYYRIIDFSLSYHKSEIKGCRITC